MIQSFRHRGLKNFYEKDNPKGLRADQVDKIARILSRLDEADRVAGMDLPGFKLHPLKGNLKGFWAVSVSGNWRIIREGMPTMSIWGTIIRRYEPWLC